MLTENKDVLNDKIAKALLGKDFEEQDDSMKENG